MAKFSVVADGQALASFDERTEAVWFANHRRATGQYGSVEVEEATEDVAAKTTSLEGLEEVDDGT